MLSRPHRRDSHPNGVLLWEEYETAKGRMPLPPHALVISRAEDSNGCPKQRYYALVCTAPKELLNGGSGILDTGALRNFGHCGKPIGASQVTAVVRRTPHKNGGLSYPITARATLAAPYAVQLAAQRRLSTPELQLLEHASRGRMTAGDWMTLAKQLRRA